MPYTQKQHALFLAAAHNPKIAKSSGIPMGKARKMVSEGVKKTNRIEQIISKGHRK